MLTKLKNSLSKTRNHFISRIDEVVHFYRKISPEFYEELEEILITGDVGVETTSLLLAKLKERIKEERTDSADRITDFLKEIISDMLSLAPPQELQSFPLAILIVGVNGVGKTTSAAKLAEHYKNDGRSCLLVAADTFRAGATRQLQIWGQRLGVEVIHHQEGADPGAVVFDGLAAVNARQTDLAIIDTAGRIHTKVNLMSELKKVHRVIASNLGQRRLVKLIVLDATTGQNALVQAKTFQEAVGIDGIILTKMDGTAKGGIILAIASQLKLPILWIGIGENLDDLKPFVAEEFTTALFEK